MLQKLSPGLRKVLNNVLWLFADRMLQMGLSLIVGLWVIRYLGPEQFGQLNYALTIVAIFGPIASLGLDSLVVRDLVKEPDAKHEILGTSLALRLASGVLTLLLSTGFIIVFKPQETLTHILVGIIAFGTVFQAFEIIDFWFRSQVQSKYTVIVKNAAYLLVCGIRIALIQLQAPLIAFAWARLGELVLASVGLVLIYQANQRDIKTWRNNWFRGKRLLKESWPLIVSGIAIYIYSTIDQVMLGSFNMVYELGIYAAAVKIAQIPDLIPSIMQISFFPKLTEAKEKSESEYLQKVQAYFDLSLLLWLVVAIPMSSFSHLIVYILGDKYIASGQVLAIYIWAQFGSGLGVARNAYIMIEGKAKNELVITLTGAVTNIVLNLFLIPRYGAVGATVATLITYFVATVLLNFILPDLRPVAGFIVRSLNLWKAIGRIRGVLG